MISRLNNYSLVFTFLFSHACLSSNKITYLGPEKSHMVFSVIMNNLEHIKELKTYNYKDYKNKLLRLARDDKMKSARHSYYTFNIKENTIEINIYNKDSEKYMSISYGYARGLLSKIRKNVLGWKSECRLNTIKNTIWATCRHYDKTGSLYMHYQVNLQGDDSIIIYERADIDEISGQFITEEVKFIHKSRPGFGTVEIISPTVR